MNAWSVTCDVDRDRLGHGANDLSAPSQIGAGDLRLVWEDSGQGGTQRWWVECAYDDCDASALDLSAEPWGELRKDA